MFVLQVGNINLSNAMLPIEQNSIISKKQTQRSIHYTIQSVLFNAMCTV